MTSYRPVVQFPPEASTTLKKVDALLGWLVEQEKYPFELPAFEGVFECEGTRMLLHYWLFLSVTRPRAYSELRIGKMNRALVGAKRSSQGFMRENIERRYKDFNEWLGAGIFHARDESFAAKLRCLGLMVVNFDRELCRQDVSEKFKEYGIPELVRINNACLEACRWLERRYVAKERSKQKVYISSRFHKMQDEFTRFRNVAVSKLKPDTIVFGTSLVCPIVIKCISEVAQTVDGTPDFLGYEKWFGNISHGDDSDFSSEDMLENTDIEKEQEFFLSQRTEPMVRKTNNVVRKDISADSGLEELIESPYQEPIKGRRRELAKASLWMSAEFPERSVVFCDEWVDDQLTRTVKFVSEDRETARNVRNKLIESGIDVRLSYVEGIDELSLDASYTVG